MNKHVKVKKHPVMELFGPTIQGEGSVLGRRTMFIRFGGCDYRCTKCDSLHAVLPQLVKEGSRYLTPYEIATELATWTPAGCTMVTFSGGNPAMHDLSELVSQIRAGYGYKMEIAVETQGTLWSDWLWECDIVTVSPKGPGMGEKFEVDKFDNFVKRLIGHPGFSVKIVIMDARDIEFAKMVLEKWPLLDELGRFYLSLGNPYPPIPGDPRTEALMDFRSELLTSYRMMVEELLQDKCFANAIITPQWHVLLWGNERGR